jgi:hypothetical protein
MNAQAAKLVRRLCAKIAPQGHAPALESRFKRMWQRTPRTKRAGLRAHMERAILARPEDVQKVFKA